MNVDEPRSNDGSSHFLNIASLQVATIVRQLERRRVSGRLERARDRRPGRSKGNNTGQEKSIDSAPTILQKRCAMTNGQGTVFKGLAGAMALAGASEAYGQIIQSTTPANFVPATGVTNPANVINWDVDGNGTNDFQFYFEQASTAGNWFSGIYGLGGVGVAAAIGYAGAYGIYVNRLTAGMSIGAGSAFAQNTGYVSAFASRFSGILYGQFNPPTQRGFVGFEFTGADGLLHFGYIDIQTSPFNSAADHGGQLFFTAFYQGTAGASILAGAVPEPGTLGALAFGAATLAGVVAYRRKVASA
jgi:hypothetical protein